MLQLQVVNMSLVSFFDVNTEFGALLETVMLGVNLEQNQKQTLLVRKSPCSSRVISLSSLTSLASLTLQVAASASDKPRNLSIALCFSIKSWL